MPKIFCKKGLTSEATIVRVVRFLFNLIVDLNALTMPSSSTNGKPNLCTESIFLVVTTPVFNYLHKRTECLCHADHQLNTPSLS